MSILFFSLSSCVSIHGGPVTEFIGRIAPDRTGRISKFNFDAYAVLEATIPQVQQNKILDSKIQRRPSRIVIKKKKSTGLLNLTAPTTATTTATTTGGLAPPESLFPGTSAGWISTLGTSVGMFPSSLGPSSSHGPPLFLRIRIADMADAGHFSTTIQAYVCCSYAYIQVYFLFVY